ncbi:cullin-associated NEDD8-dissociated protein 1-like isoform X1 [Bufo gargarizans]|uniref:cullin-associated NEDD8-dissociated protein 1-like isoform X1 n=2 Tax=Bufo gargarizans TaxID=30331 RepID=UPI001CF5A860|nr:cullin-associated NEDD8-dissociated protein 1-like isoform X1 [Bufo gargarizans]
MSSVTYHISSLLEKMTSSDKDFRFMATNDLMVELQKDSIKLDEDSERRVVKMLLKLLEDKNGEVQNLAVKCLGPLVGKVKEHQVETIVDTLCSNMLSEKEQLRDICSIGLKTVISELPAASSGSSLAANVCRKITGQLTAAIGKCDDAAVQLEALDILSDMLGRLGGALFSFHASILSCLLPQLTSPRLAVRKRAVLALGHLVQSCNGNLFTELVEHLVAEMKKNESTSTTRTYIQCVTAVSLQAGHRLGPHLERIVPLVVGFCKVEDDEMQEQCFQALDSFIRRCPKEISPYVPTVLDLCLKYIAYDPNYNYDSEEEEEMMETESEEEPESEEEYSDDDDMSWKVRRSAAKCLETLITARPDLLPEFYRSVAPVIISRFKEREENVKADIFSAFNALLRQTRCSHSCRQNVEVTDKGESPLSSLQKQVPLVMKSLHKLLRDKSIKSRQGCFAVLTELTSALPGCLSQHIPALVPGLVFSLTDKGSSSNMRLDTLMFLHVILSGHPPECFQPHLPALLPPVVACIYDPFYKITSEALLVAQQLVKVIRPLDQTKVCQPSPYTKELFCTTLKRLQATDIDQEVKERALSCMGHLISHLGDQLGNDLLPTLQLILERLRNEITRLTAVKVLTLIAGSPLKIDLRSLLKDALPTLASFLRKNQRALRLGTVSALEVLVRNYNDCLKPTMLEPVLGELPSLLAESDMYLAQVSIDFLTTLVSAHPASLPKLSARILPQLFQLVHSPLLQGGALASILSFLRALVVSHTPHLGYADLLKQLTGPVQSAGPTLHKQAFHSVAKCVATLASACPKESNASITQFIQDAKNPRVEDAVKVLAFLTLAEIGRERSLGNQQKELKNVILEALASPSEEVKSAASYALGNACVGSPADFLPFLLHEIGGQLRRQYLLLHSLKEALTCLPSEELRPYQEDVWKLLLQHCEATEEGTRNVVAECVGKLTLVNPAQLLPRLCKQLSSGSAYTRSTVVTAIKFTISDQPAPIDPLLKNCIGDFLKPLQDPDPNVRRVTLVMFNSAAHNKPSLVRKLLSRVLPPVYEETKVRKELIREVEMGPFKHTVDDGLDVRKAAFECMYTLLENCLDQLDIYEYLNHVEDGLKDHYDIRMLTFIILTRLATLCPSAVIQRLDQLIEPLRATCTTKVKAGSVKQEFEKQDELKRSAMRTITALLNIPEVENSRSMVEFLTQIRANPELSSLMETIQKDSVMACSSEIMDIS